jgi:hypothetical protein
VIRSDSGVTHRLSLSARVVSAVDRQVKAKRQDKKLLRYLRNRGNRDSKGAIGVAPGDDDERARELDENHSPVPDRSMRKGQAQIRSHTISPG